MYNTWSSKKKLNVEKLYNEIQVNVFYKTDRKV